MRYFRNYEYIIYITGIYLIVVGFYKKKKTNIFMYTKCLFYFSLILF